MPPLWKDPIRCALRFQVYRHVRYTRQLLSVGQVRVTLQAVSNEKPPKIGLCPSLGLSCTLLYKRLPTEQKRPKHFPVRATFRARGGGGGLP